MLDLMSQHDVGILITQTSSRYLMGSWPYAVTLISRVWNGLLNFSIALGPFSQYGHGHYSRNSSDLDFPRVLSRGNGLHTWALCLAHSPHAPFVYSKIEVLGDQLELGLKVGSVWSHCSSLFCCYAIIPLEWFIAMALDSLMCHALFILVILSSISLASTKV
ncbi:hypothetical protein HAX54_018132 [Datura stramonium]|uniref:Uncharacterized protein n=1 Tax=Datura stramonium TaxID=4076 RepID=A0ABS8UP02_DATST|nr:hypothetical protein [Datura stramonium]